MAIFPHSSAFFNPWKKNLFFFMSGEAPSSGAEALPAWKETLLLQIEQAELRTEDEDRLRKEVKDWKPTENERQDQFELRMRYATNKAEIAKRTGEKYGDLVKELTAGKKAKDALPFLQNTEGKSLSDHVADHELEQGKQFTVNFGVGVEGINQTQARQAQRRIGLHHIFADQPEITRLAVTDTKGNTVTVLRCPDGRYREEGKLNKKRHHPIYQGYSVKILEIGGKDEAKKMATQEAEMKSDQKMEKAAQSRLQDAQASEAKAAESSSVAQNETHKKAALEMAGVQSGKPEAVASEIALSPEEEQAFNEQNRLLRNGVNALTQEVFLSDSKAGEIKTACEQELTDKKFKSIVYEGREGELQKVTLTLVDKKGIEHKYTGTSSHPIGVNAFVDENLPGIAPGAESVKAYAWNREAFKDLIKDLAKTGGEIVHPEHSSPYDNGVIYGGVRKAATTGEEGGTLAEVANPEYGKAHQNLSQVDRNNDGSIDIKDYEYVQSLKTGEGARLPDALKKWTVADFEANKHRIDHMDQFWDSLQVLGKQSGKTEMELLRPFLDGNKITYQELCRQVYGQSPEKLWEDYSEMRDALTRQNAQSDSEKTNIKKKDRMGESKDEYYTYAELKAATQNDEAFFEASYRLLEATRVLEKNKSSIVEGSVENGTPETAKKLVAQLFDPTDTAPLARRTLGEVLRGEEIEASMDSTHRDYLMKGENRYETHISSAGAYALLLGEFAHGAEMDYKGLSARLTQMRKAGLLFYEQMAPKDQERLNRSLAKEWGITAEAVPAKLKAAAEGAALDENKLQSEKPFTPEEILLIQLGMIPEASRREAADVASVERIKLKEMNEEARNKVAEAVKAIGKAYQEKTGQTLSEEELKSLEQEALNQLVIRENKGALGLAFKVSDGNVDAGAGYARELVRVPMGDKGYLSINAGVGVACIEELRIVETLSVGADVKVGTRFGKEDQNRASAAVGAAISVGKVNLGAKVGIQVKKDSERVWYLGTGVGAAVGLGLEEGGTSVKLAYLEAGRDLNAAAQRKFRELKEKNPEFEKELNDYILKTLDAYRAEIDAQTEGMSEVEKNQYLHILATSIAEIYLQERGNEAISEMCAIQFGKIGVAAGVGLTGFLIPYFGVSFKGRRVVRYFKSSDAPNMDAIAEAKLREQIAAETQGSVGDVVYLSGNLTMTESGERSIENSMLKFEEMGSLEGINTKLRAQGMELVPSANDASKLQLRVKNADGFVNLYIDPASGIQASIGADGMGYLNLDYHDALSILRIDKNTAFKEGGGGVKNVDIYISNNPQKTPSSIKDQTGDRLTWRQTDIYPADSGKNTLETAMHIKRNTYVEGTAVYKNEAEMLAAIAADGLGDLNNVDAKTARETLQKRIQVILEQSESAEGEPRVEQLDEYIDVLIKSRSISYIQLTSDAAYSKAILDGAKTKLGGTLSNEEATYLLQNLLVESRAKTPGSAEALAKHILGWNTEALNNFCAQHGLDKTMSALIMEHYAQTLSGLGGADLPSESLGTGYAFHTLIGPTATGELGRGINSKFSSELAGTEAVTVENLITKFGMSEEQANAFIAAQLSEFRHLKNVSSENADPMTRVRSPLGMQLLEQAPALFDPQTAEALVKAVESKSIDKEAAYWKIFADALNQLETTGTYLSSSGYALSRDFHMVMGFLESCRNFTVAYKEKSLTLRQSSVKGVNTYQGATGSLGNNFTSAAAAVKVAPEPKPSEQGSVEVIDKRQEDGGTTENKDNTLN
ncbi:hypothetical protein IPG41_01615 [Candidatus Peregrinibacteria bacterium]|nr:MAG: hypothetical protein IPG41_01615 [Candidatus Peregrinibacteria bacterium]